MGNKNDDAETRIGGASKILQDDPVCQALQSHQEDNADNEFISFSAAGGPMKPMAKSSKDNIQPSPWMLKKNGQSNEAFVMDGEPDNAQISDEAIQSKALPWRRNEDHFQAAPKAQDEFPACFNTDGFGYNRNIQMPWFNINRRDSQASSSAASAGSRRNSELELQHQANLSEADIENRRQ